MSRNLGALIGEWQQRTYKWWQQRTPTEKKLLIIVPTSVLIVVIVPIVVILCTMGSRREMNIAKALRNAMDISVDPCQDFYKFTCGNWGKSYEKNTTVVNAVDILQNNVKIDFLDAVKKHLSKTNLIDAEKKLLNAYNSCFNSTFDNDAFLDFVNEVGGYPPLQKGWKESDYDLNAGIANAILYFGVAPFVDVSVLPYEKNTSRNFITLSTPASGSRLMDPKMPELWNFQRKQNANVNNQMKQFNAYLQKIWIETFKLSRKDEFMFVKLKDLNKKFVGVDYAKIIQIVINSSLQNTEKFIKDDEQIAVASYHYMNKFAELVKNGSFPSSIYAIYIGQSIYSKYFGRGMFGAPPTNRTRTGKELKQKEAICLQTLLKRFNFITDRFYIHEVGANSKRSIKQLLEIIDYLKDSFEILAKQSDWIDSTTFSKIKEKLHGMRNFVGYPQWILDDKKLNSYYKNLSNMGYDYKTNIMKLNKFWMEKQSSKLFKLNDLNEWRTYPIVAVNALYDAAINGMHIPLSVLNIPFFYQDMPWYLNFGALGAVVGHEITHGFDTKGKFHDKDGNIDNLWTNKTQNEFLRKVMCFIDQYNSYIDPHTGSEANGLHTVQENIADNGGIRQAFLAYQKWVEKHGKERLLPGFEGYTPNQLFFLSYAHLWCSKPVRKPKAKFQSHSSHPIRVLGAISNMKEFATSFNCKQGTRMNPVKRCIIW